MSLSYKQFTFEDDKEIRNCLRTIYGFGWHKSMLLSAKIGLAYPYFPNDFSVLHFNLLCIWLDSLV
jgi:hypothetical protein